MEASYTSLRRLNCAPFKVSDGRCGLDACVHKSWLETRERYDALIPMARRKNM